jgi:SAM-dependent methyltransferase
MRLKNSYGHACGELHAEGIVLDIGCGMGRRKNTIGLDITPTEQTDYVVDFERSRWPFFDRSVEKIFAYNMLEHLSAEGLLLTLTEAWRVLKDGAEIEIIVPNAGHEVDFGDPTHKTHFNKRTFAYFTKSKPKYHSYMPDHPWKILELTIKQDDKGEDELIFARMTPDR